MGRKKKDDGRQVRFAHELVFGQHADHLTKSALAAGYTGHYARNAGQILALPRVKALVDKLRGDRESALKSKYLRVAEEVYSQSIANLTDAFDEHGNLRPMKDWPEDLQRGLAKCEVELAPAGKGQADDGDYDRPAAGLVAKIALIDKRSSQELFLKWAGKLKDVVQHEGLTLEELALAADKKLRAQRAAE